MTPQIRYPTQFPAQEFRCVSAYLRGAPDAPDLACTAECAWNLQGYAMSFIPHDHPLPVGEAVSVADCSNEELATKLDECCESGQKMHSTSVGAGAPSWVILLLPLARELANRLIDKLLDL